ncbi:MAG TPA: Ppx/GppA phosphatase family protein [Solirubrobacteraceae bacterium]|jgi:exopolyphosphatase/guanosine-5'-triphosphate,3'-diphosphate pyrophosphatase
MQPDERLAVIDLGSNSFRLVVFTAADGWWKRTDEIYEPVRIGEGLAASGRLGERPMKRALATLDVFAHFCRAAGLMTDPRSARAPAGGAVDAVATSAIRDAENAAEFLTRARELTGLPIRVLSREQEARYGYLAAVNSTTLTDGCVLDLGGGSLQLVRVEDRLARESGSWRVGAVRMSERFMPPNGPAKRKQLEELRDHVAGELEQADWLPRAGRRLVGIGGTVRSLATAAQRAAGLPSNGVQGMVIEREALDQLVERLAALPAAERSSIPGVKPARADLILAGALVVQVALEAGGFDGLEATEAGLREGVFFERLLAGQGSDADRSPLFEDLRRTSVMNLATRYNVDAAHTRHVAALALGMFDELARLGLHDGDARERELLWAACMLHDIGMSVDYDDHHKHSRYLILNGGLPGFTPIEVATIAQAARYHRKGMPDPGPLAALFEPDDMARLNRCAVLLRLAEDLERSRDQLVRGVDISLLDGKPDEGGGTAGGEVELRVIADGEAAVPRWAASRETELFARAFHHDLSVAA